MTKAKAAPEPAEPVASFESVAEAWRRTRHSRYAKIAEVLSAKEPPRPALGASGKKVDVAAWQEVERADDWRDVPRLAATIGAGPSALATDRVTLLGRRDDPRLAPALLELVAEPPYTSGTSRNFWRAVVAALTASRDVRARDAMLALSKRYKLINDTELGSWLATQMNRAATQMDGDPPLSAADEQALAALEAKLDIRDTPPVPAPQGGAPESLFAAIVANLDDDASRLIYADMLSERGDERGELIVLQVDRAAGRGTPDRSDLEREKFTKTDRIKRFAVPISAAADHVSFERGFPVGVTLGKHGLASVVDAPEWGTVRRLLQTSRAPVKAVIEFLNRGAAAQLVEVGGLEPRVLDKVKAPALPWTKVGFSKSALEPKHLARLPHLTSLEIWTFGLETALDPQIFAAAPALVALRVSDALPADAPAALQNNKHLRILSLGSRVEPDPFAGLPIEDLEVWADVHQVDHWLGAIPTIKRLSIRSPNAEFRPLVGVLEKHPRLERLEWSRVVWAPPLRLERGAEGFRLIVPPGVRSPEHQTKLCALAEPARSAGIATLVLYPSAPRHEAPPLDPALVDAVRQAWGEDRVQTPDLL